MDDQLFNSLLYRSEDPTIDFKQEQYVVTRHDVPEGLSKQEAAKYLEDKKSELLKDLLAMANSWRDGPGYIVLGFRENKGGLPEIIGINPERMHDDAQFQQFIAGKVNSPLTFTYHCREYRGVPIGVFTVPKQRRPLYAKANFGVVEAGVVYLRRGSSTAKALPDEIADMGADNVRRSESADVGLRLWTEQGHSFADETLAVRIPDFGAPIEELPDYSAASGPFGVYYGGLVNRAYIRELAEFVRTRNQAIGVQAVLTNRSSFPLTSCQLHVQASQGESALALQEDGTDASAPSKQMIAIKIRSRLAPMTIDVSKHGGRDTAILHMPRLLPRQALPAPDLFSIFPCSTGPVLVSSTLYASELPEPVVFQLQFNVSAEIDRWSVDRLLAHESDE